MCVSPSEPFPHAKDPKIAAHGDCVNMLEPREFRKSDTLLKEAYKTNLIDSKRSAELDVYSVKEWRILKNLEKDIQLKVYDISLNSEMSAKQLENQIMMQAMMAVNLRSESFEIFYTGYGSKGTGDWCLQDGSTFSL